MGRRRRGILPSCDSYYPTPLPLLILSVCLSSLFASAAAFLTSSSTSLSPPHLSCCDLGRRQRRHPNDDNSSKSMSLSYYHYHYYYYCSRSCYNNNNSLLRLSRQQDEDIYAAVHRKEYEMKRLNSQHASLSDPVRMAMGYVQDGVEKKRLAAALRRVHDDPDNNNKTNEERIRENKLLEYGLAEPTMRRGSFIVDIKRKSALSYPDEKQFARYDDAGLVAEAMVRLGADVVFVNVDYHSYGGDMNELKSAISSVRRVNDHAAVVMKDIVVDEIQLGLAKEAGADGILLMASVLGPALENFLNAATVIGLETIVECHTYNEVQAALDALAQNIMVSNRDRITGQLLPDQAIKLAGLFPGSGGPIVTIAGGGICTTDQMKKLLTAGYDGVVVGRAVMGSERAPEFIRAVRDRTLLPAEFSSQWGLEDVEFDPSGNVMSGPKMDIPTPEDPDVFL